MTEDPLAFIHHELPALFEQGVQRLRERAETGERRAGEQLADIESADGTAYIEVEGDGGCWLVVREGRMRAVDEAPADPPVRLAIAVPPDVVRAAVRELHRAGAGMREQAAVGTALSVSRRAQDLVEGQVLQCHLTVSRVPDHGDVVLRVALGAGTPPRTPGFTATVRYEDLEDVREGDLGPQQLLTTGRVRFGGNYAPALQLGMQLAQVFQNR
jgi:hypothetical protein